MSKSTACRLDNGAIRFLNGSVLRLGDPKKGPSFKTEIAKTKAVLLDTIEQPKVKTWRQMLAGHASDWCCLHRYAGSSARRFGHSYLLLRTPASFEQEIDNAQGRLRPSLPAEKQFSEAELDRLKAAVYVVGKKVDDTYKPVATAWAFESYKLATNAHVASM